MEKLPLQENTAEILKLAVPAALERLLLLFSGILGMMIAGKINNQTLVAVSMCNTIFDIVQAVFLGLSLGATIQITRFVSLKNHKMTGTIAAQSIVIACSVGIAVAGVFLGAGSNIIQALFKNLSDQVVADCVKYLNIGLWCLPFMGVDIALSSCMRAIGDAKTPFVMTMMANGVQILLAWVLTSIFKMGLVGMAIAFLIARITGAILRIVAISKRNRFPELSLKGNLRPQMTIIKNILRNGSVTMTEQLMLQLGFLGMQLITSHIDTDMVGAYQIANSTISIVYAITFGFETAQLILIGNRLSVYDNEGAWAIGKKSFFMTEIISCVIAGIMALFSGAFLRLFSDDPVMIENAKIILWILALLVPITSAYQGVTGALKVGGQAPVVLVLNLVGPWCIRIPLAYLLCVLRRMGLTGLMLGLFADYSFRAVFYLVTFYRKRWIKQSNP